MVLEDHWEDTCPEPSWVNGIEQENERIRDGEQDNLITNYVSTGVRGVEEGNNYVNSDESGD